MTTATEQREISDAERNVDGVRDDGSVHYSVSARERTVGGRTTLGDYYASTKFARTDGMSGMPMGTKLQTEGELLDYLQRETAGLRRKYGNPQIRAVVDSVEAERVVIITEQNQGLADSLNQQLG